jgi:hypothetical protein
MNNHESKGAEPNSSSLLSKLLSVLPTAIAAAVATLWVTFAGWLTPEHQQWTFRAKLVLQAGGLLVLVLLYLGGLYLRLWLRSRTRVAFGILWDMRNNPICPKCRGPLTKHSASSLQCPSCQSAWEITDRHGGYVLWWDAIARMDAAYPLWFKRKRNL